MELNSRIYVAGHRGLVGSAFVRLLESKGYQNIITCSHENLDLCNQAATNQFFKEQRVDYVLLAAAKVGGILFNQTYQADFIYENVMIASNVIKAAADYGVKKLLFLGSSCIYPKLAPQPIKEEYLLSDFLEPSNEGYALAKITGLKLCEKFFHQYNKMFISCMPTNLYGPGDNFHPTHSHVIPGLLRRFHEAKVNKSSEVVLWGSGTPRREFLHVDDCAAALYLLLEKYEQPGTVNVGSGVDLTIKHLAEIIKEVVGFQGEITLDISKPDGTPRKVLDVSKLKALGWRPAISFEQGLADSYQWALANKAFS